MIATTNIVAVGLSSLFPDARMGTDQEQHVLFVDVDGDDPDRDPDGWRSALHLVARRYKLGTLYVRRTLKGRHLFSPTLATAPQHEAAEAALEQWGGDGWHRQVGYLRGQTILRVTPKPGEAPAVVESTHHGINRYVPGTSERQPTFSVPHFVFLEQLWAGMTYPRGVPVGQAGMMIRLERYKTRAITRKQEVGLC